MKILALILFLIITTSCESEVEGTMSFGPEAMYFTACETNEKWWLADYRKAKGWQEVEAALNSQPECSLSTMPCKHQSTIVSGNAKISGNGKFGHLGKYPREITFTNIKVIKANGVCSY